MSLNSHDNTTIFRFFYLTGQFYSSLGLSPEGEPLEFLEQLFELIVQA